MPQRKIVTDYWPKPIPLRYFDWAATRDGWDLGEPIGYGATEQAAIDDLKAQEIIYEEDASTGEQYV